MGLFDLFKRKPKAFDVTRALILANMEPGFFVDYDLESYEVMARHYYDLGDDDGIDEWVLNSGRKTYYLERYEDDDVEWSLSQKIPIGAIEPDIRNHIKKHDDPPSRITYQGTEYYLDDCSAGHFFENGKGSGQEFISWTFVDGTQDQFLTIEQWDEDTFETAAGTYVQEYQFTNLLPGGKHHS